MTALRRVLFGFLLLLAVVAFYLPWLWHPTAGLSAGGYDLAEWASLHPASRQGNPPLVDSFFIRAEMPLIVLLVGLYASQCKDKKTRWMLRAAGLLLVLTLFPPLEFLTSARSDVNYQQQFGLGVLTMLVLVASMWGDRMPPHIYHAVAAAGAVITLAFSLIGTLRSAALLSKLGITYGLGAGMVLLISVLGITALLHLYSSISIRQVE